MYGLGRIGFLDKPNNERESDSGGGGSWASPAGEATVTSDAWTAAALPTWQGEKKKKKKEKRRGEGSVPVGRLQCLTGLFCSNGSGLQ